MASLEAMCETCGEPNEKRNMHVVNFERVVGRSSGTTTARRNGSSHSTSHAGRSPTRFTNGQSNGITSRSNNRVYKKIERVWVCNTCRDPFQPGMIIGKLVKFGIFIFVAWIAGTIAWHALVGPANHLPSLSAITASAPSRQHAIAVEHNVAVPQPTKHQVTFAVPSAVVQSLPGASNDYPPCSATVTDHCVGK